MAEKIKKVNPKKDDLYQVLSNDLKTMKDDLVTEVKVSAAQVASMYKGVKDASASSASALAQEVRYGYKQNQNIYEGIATLVKAEVAAKIKKAIDLDPRVTVLGHIQRGGTPTGRDRINATKMGYLAVELLLAGKTNRIVCTHCGTFTDVAIEDGLAMKKDIQQMEVDVLAAMTGL